MVRQTGPIHDLGAPCMPNHNGIFAAVRRRHTRGETRSFSPLANHPVFFGREQTYRSLPEDLRHLLPQIRARCARKSKSLFPPAAHLLQATRRVDSTPRGVLFPSRRGAHRAPASGAASVPLTLPEQPGGSRKASFTPARAARPKGNGVIRKGGETLVSPLLCARRAQRHRLRRLQAASTQVIIR